MSKYRIEPLYYPQHPPEPVWEKSLPNSQTPIVVDFGSHSTRAGFANDKNPFLNFPSIISRQITKRKTVGNDVLHLKLPQYDTPFALGSDVPYHFSNVETIFDHMFAHLGLASKTSIKHPVVVSEAVLAPPSIRRVMTETLFEAYGVTGVDFGIDALFSYLQMRQENLIDPSVQKGKFSNIKDTSLVIRSGFNTSHIIPVIDGKWQKDKCIRLDLGGSACSEFLERSLHLAASYHSSALTKPLCEDLVRRHCYVAEDYSAGLSHWQNVLPKSSFGKFPGIPEIADGIESNPIDGSAPESPLPIKIQLPFTKAKTTGVNAGLTQDEIDKRTQRIADERRQRLKDIHDRKRAEKIMVKRQQKIEYDDIFRERESNPEAFEDQLQQLDETAASLMKKLSGINDFLREHDDAYEESSVDIGVPGTQKPKKKVKEKNADSEQTPEEEIAEAKAQADSKYPLADAPSADMTEEEKKEKKKQKTFKAMALGRLRKKEEKLLAKRAAEERERVIREEVAQDPWAWKEKIEAKMKELLVEISRKKKERTVQSHGRRSASSVARMKALTTLESEGAFGDADGDWDAYKMNTGSNSAEAEAELASLKKLRRTFWHESLPELTPVTLKQSKTTSAPAAHPLSQAASATDRPLTQKDFQIPLDVLRCRAPEIIFQPDLIGLRQMGLIEAISYILSRFSKEDARALFSNVVLTGGNMSFPGARNRIYNELRTLAPMEDVVRVVRATDPVVDAWRGASLFAKSQTFPKTMLSRKKYLEEGADYILENSGRHFSSN